MGKHTFLWTHVPIYRNGPPYSPLSHTCPAQPTQQDDTCMDVPVGLSSRSFSATLCFEINFSKRWSGDTFNNVDVSKWFAKHLGIYASSIRRRERLITQGPKLVTPHRGTWYTYKRTHLEFVATVSWITPLSKKQIQPLVSRVCTIGYDVEICPERNYKSVSTPLHERETMALSIA